MATLADIRARLAKQAENSTWTSRENVLYPHWNIPEGKSSVIRFLPDADQGSEPENPYFWRERLMIKLPFAGIKGQINSKAVVVQVPCVEMWEGMTCPVLTEVRGWFKDPDLEELGRKYWKKRSYIFQGFVNENALVDDVVPENPIRRFVISTSIFTLIRSLLMDPDIKELPTDYHRGLNFRITKTMQGKYADYGTSSWARMESSLTDAQLQAIDTFGLFDLKSFLPNKPNEEALHVIAEMFRDSVDGEAYDVEKYGNFYRPYGIEAPSKTTVAGSNVPSEDNIDPDDSVEDVVSHSANTKKVVKSDRVAPKVQRPSVDEVFGDDMDDAPTPTVTSPNPSDSSKRAEDILKMIRSRPKK